MEQLTKAQIIDQIKGLAQPDNTIDLTNMNFKGYKINLGRMEADEIYNTYQKADRIYNGEQEASVCIINVSQKAIIIFNDNQKRIKK